MRIAVILNGISLFKGKFYQKYLPLIKRHHEVEVFETISHHHAVSLSAKASSNRFDLIIAAGGDGTIHQVVNGILENLEPPTVPPALAVLPLGSGNDFARSIKTDNSPEGFLSRIDKADVKTIDVGEVFFSMGNRAGQGKRYFVNVVDVGMGPSVVRGVLRSGRAFGSAIAYYQSIITTFFKYKPVHFHAKAQDWEWQGPMRSFAIANAKYFGNGLCIAPDAKLDDEILNVFACGGVSVLDFIIQSLPLKQGRFVKHPDVSYFKAQSIELSSETPLEIEADGEILGWLPAKVTLSSHKLNLLL